MIKDTQIGIYKISHHGSRDAISDKIVKTLQPTVVAISQGKNNKFDHPHKEAIAALESHRIPYYKTEKSGDIEFITDGRNLIIKTDRE
ncbi:MAG: hypothetical protein M3Q44_00670 [bacterium]|nr:hypothetical protein [bacterium]